jgi:dTDP-4-dehydrorhamnose reductase
MFKVLVAGAKGQVDTKLVNSVPIGSIFIVLGSDQLDITD